LIGSPDLLALPDLCLEKRLFQPSSLVVVAVGVAVAVGVGDLGKKKSK
jgi:hypothetical protein